ncbi:phospholipase A [Rubrivivax benzoatilyticus]|uniref:Phospholipase A1 n=2 Tax=Rubrivivax benzoatilyticus TaxID=316997 RepID=A0ABX0HQ29_9BURK|nr:phospholipase A [Rubrivivax benzoatilyticus]NHK97172.1 phospholipase A [Rubrivivax benzoatilyticus]NHL23133.1 phospholipase A [Rubrivivax benzoatilyticus]
MSVRLLPVPLLCACAAAVAQTPDARLAACVEIAAAPDRLACYDRLAGRAPVAPPPAAEAPPTLLAARGAPVADPAEPRETSLLSRFWELDRADKRGIFNFTGYRPSYVMPVHYTDRINRRPKTPTQPELDQPNYRNVEAKFQLSVRAKLAQGLLLPDADLWFGYTQQVLWQIWNTTDSKPFRNADYEPELIYMVPTPQGLQRLPLGWRWRFTELGLAHQSNGQSDPLSRSWNRSYLGAGLERGPWTLQARIAHRLSESRADDDNPDLVHYRGRADFTLGWASGPHAASLLYRTTLKEGRTGAFQFDYTYPVFSDQPNGLRWYFQLFSGYGETLTDYNFRQNSVGLGLSFVQF